MKFDFTPDPKVLIALTHTPMQPYRLILWSKDSGFED